MKTTFALCCVLYGAEFALGKIDFIGGLSSVAKSSRKGLMEYEKPHLFQFGVNPVFYTNQSLGLTDIPEFDAKCEAVLEIAYIHDSTESYTNDVPMLQERLPQMVDVLQSSFPGSRFSLSQFRDKNIVPLGYNSESWTDECFALISSLQDPVEKLLSAVDAVYTAGGYDYRESQLSAMLRAALTKQMQWSPPDVLNDPATGLPLVRVMMLTTDCTWHEAGDAEEAAALTGTSVQPNTLHLNPSLLDDDVNALCGEVEYPTYENLAQVLKERRIIPVFLVQPCFYVDANGNHKAFPEFKATAAETGEPKYADPKDGMLLFYRDLLAKLNLNGIVAPLDEAASDLAKRLEDVLNMLPEAVCNTQSTTTTTAPAETDTEAATTTAALLTTTTAAPSTTTVDMTTTTTGAVETITEPSLTTTTATAASTQPPPTAEALTTPEETTAAITEECECECTQKLCDCCMPNIDIDIHLEIEA